jgi:Zn-dependent peptidase ImmA (M78 family)
VAHEIGHYVKRSAGPEDYEYVDRRDTLSSRGSDPDEVYANAFAANLLMPKDEVERFKSRTPLELAHYFGVSPEAMSYRLANLGIADRS